MGSKAKKAVFIFLLFIVCVGIVWISISLVWFSKGKEGTAVWPAVTVTTLFPYSRKITKIYHFSDLVPNFLGAKPFGKLVVEVVI